VFLVVTGILIRIDALYGIVIFLLPACVAFLLSNYSSESNKRFIGFSTITILSILAVLYYQNSIQHQMMENDYEFMNYVRFQDVLNTYTPASLKLHQEIISGNVMRGIWSNVDFIILRNWAYADFSVFGYKNMRLGSESVSSLTGLKGLMNADLLERSITGDNRFNQLFISSFNQEFKSKKNISIVSCIEFKLFGRFLFSCRDS